MKLVFKNNIEIHFYDKHSYITDENGTHFISSDATRMIKDILNGVNEIDDLAKKYIGLLENAKLRVSYTKFQNIYNTIVPFIELCSDDSQMNANQKICVSGCEGYCYPKEIQISLTNKCLQYCKHCYENSNCSREDIEYSTLCSFLDKVKNYVNSIYFTGGEPFLYPHLETVIKKYEKDFSFRIITSGNWGEKDISDELLKKFVCINLSIYGASEAEHDEFTGCKGSYRCVANTIQKFNELGCQLYVQTQVRNSDEKYLDKFVENCIEMQVKNLILGFIYPVGRARFEWKKVNEEEIEQKIQSLKKRYGNQINIIFKNEKKFSVNSEFFKCGAGRLKWHVSENGTIVPCALVDRDIFAMGKISEDLSIHPSKIEKYFDSWKMNREEIERTYQRKGIMLQDICEHL